MNPVEYFELEGRYPFYEWINGLDESSRARIAASIARVRAGGAKNNIRSLGEISEIKVNVGPGYRVYFSTHQRKVIVLLLGGDKDTQNKDIKTAKKYWRIYHAQKRRL